MATHWYVCLRLSRGFALVVLTSPFYLHALQRTYRSHTRPGTNAQPPVCELAPELIKGVECLRESFRAGANLELSIHPDGDAMQSFQRT